MPYYTHENYCQEVWDLGRAVDKLNDYIRQEYWEICEPEETQRIYKFIKSFVCKFRRTDIDLDDNNEEEDRDLELELFEFYSQERFNRFFEIFYNRIVQFPHREKFAEHVEVLIMRLRELNTWFESPTGQMANWWRIHHQFLHDVNMSFWNNNQLMNFIPLDDDTQPSHH